MDVVCTRNKRCLRYGTPPALSVGIVEVAYCVFGDGDGAVHVLPDGTIDVVEPRAGVVSPSARPPVMAEVFDARTGEWSTVAQEEDAPATERTCLATEEGIAKALGLLRGDGEIVDVTEEELRDRPKDFRGRYVRVTGGWEHVPGIKKSELAGAWLRPLDAMRDWKIGHYRLCVEGLWVAGDRRRLGGGDRKAKAMLLTTKASILDAPTLLAIPPGTVDVPEDALRRDPHAYDGWRIRVTAVYRQGFEESDFAGAWALPTPEMKMWPLGEHRITAEGIWRASPGRKYGHKGSKHAEMAILVARHAKD